MGLGKLPLDLCFIVLVNLSDLKSLRSCIFACKSLYSAYKARERLILADVLYDELGPELFAMAVDVQLVDVNLDDPLLSTIPAASQAHRKRMREIGWQPSHVLNEFGGRLSLPGLAKTHAEILRLSAEAMSLMEMYGSHTDCSDKFVSMMGLPEPRRTNTIYKCYYLWFLIWGICEKFRDQMSESEDDEIVSEKLHYLACKVWNWRYDEFESWDAETFTSVSISLIVATEVRFLWGIIASPDMRPPEDFFSVSTWHEFHWDRRLYDRGKQYFIDRPEEEVTKRRKGGQEPNEIESYIGSSLFRRTWSKILNARWHDDRMHIDDSG